MSRFGMGLAPAISECILTYGDVRISVLSDKILRIEKGGFTDYMSQMVFCRNFAKPEFTVEKSDNKVTIQTNFAKFIVDTNTLKVGIKSGSNIVYPSNKTNMGGTARTLDGTFGILGSWKTKREKTDHFCLGHLRKGIFSTNGISEIDDSKNLLLDADGKMCQRKSGSIDKYVFAFGDDYLGGLKEFYALTGATPILPKYALGNWWSRYHAYSDKEYMDLMDKFEEKDIPLSVATIDMDWHIVKNVPKDVPRKTFQGAGWTGYTFEKSLFPDYKAFLKNLKDRNLAITMNLHPRDGVRYYECQYNEMAKACDIDPATKKPVEFDLTNDKFLNAYFDILHHPYEKDGVDFWWIDWQQGSKSSLKGLDPLWLLNHYHMMDICRDDNKGIILSRYAGLGSHRYPLGFSGDTIVCWKSLKYQPYFTSLASNAGYTWWSHDIGGHVMNHGDNNIYLRWVQYGVFSPINRLHSNVVGLSKEPWLYPQVESIAEDFLRLRHRLLPFLYTANIKTAKEGIPLISPMYYYTKDANAYSKKYRDQYYFGENMFVCPVVSKGDNTEQDIWLPEGNWTHFFTGERYKGGEHRIVTPYKYYPVFVKDGSIIPLLKERKGNSREFDELEIKVYLGNGAYTLYDDNGSELKFEISQNKDGYALNITKSDNCKTKHLIVSIEGIKSAKITLNGAEIGNSKQAEINCDACELQILNVAR